MLAKHLGTLHICGSPPHAMPDPAPAPSSPQPPRLPVSNVLSAIASENRWYILRELARGEALPVSEVAHRLGATLSGTSKHFAVLLASGVVRQTYGGHYTIEPRFRVPGELAIDLGHVRLRFD